MPFKYCSSCFADCLKDLQRFLRQDDQYKRDCFFTLGNYQTARHELVPLITTYAADTDLVYNARESPDATETLLSLFHSGNNWDFKVQFHAFS